MRARARNLLLLLRASCRNGIGALTLLCLLGSPRTRALPLEIVQRHHWGVHVSITVPTNHEHAREEGTSLARSVCEASHPRGFEARHRAWIMACCCCTSAPGDSRCRPRCRGLFRGICPPAFLAICLSPWARGIRQTQRQTRAFCTDETRRDSSGRWYD